MTKRTNEEYDKLIGPEYIRLEPYVSANTKIKHRHNQCGHEWAARPDRMIGNSRACPNCRVEIRGAANRRSESEYDSLLDPQYKRLEPFAGSLTKITHRHLPCGHEWSVQPSKLLVHPGRCPQCYRANAGANRTRTNEQYDAALDSQYVRLEPYHSAHTKILHRHIPCGHEWLVAPNTLLTKIGRCPHCGQITRNEKATFTDDEYDSRIAGHYIRLEPYKGAAVKIAHRHIDCGHEWRALPLNLTSNLGSCPGCAKYGFNDSVVGHLYILDIGGRYIKYGITNNIERRRREITESCGNEVRVLRSWSFHAGSVARDLERLIKMEFGGRWADPSLLPDGWTETLDASSLDEVITFAERYVRDSGNGTIDS